MRYQYTSTGFKGYKPVINWSIPDGVKLIITINIIVFILVELSGYRYEIFRLCGLVPADSIKNFRFWQPITYLFLHSGLLHIIINMIILWMFGRELEFGWGKYKFLTYYFITGIGAAIITVIFNLSSYIPIVGASGAVYGILMAYGLSFPNRVVYLYGLFPIKIKYLITFLGITAFLYSTSNSRTTISHITHLSGMLIGFIYLKRFNLLNNWSHWFPKIKLHDIDNNDDIVHKSEETKLKDDINMILDKLKENGWEGLSAIEKKKLFSASKYYSKKQNPN